MISIKQVDLLSVPISITSLENSLAVVMGWLIEARQNKVTRLQGYKVNTSGNLTTSQPANLFVSGLAKLVVTPNPEIVVAAQTDRGLMAALRAADLAIPDGWGVVWALRLLRFTTHNSQPCRLSGLALMEALIAEAGKRGWKVMLVGGRPGVAGRAAKTLSELPRHSKRFEIVGLSGPQDINNVSRSESARLLAAINKFKPDLLFIGFGHGKQEPWMLRHRDQIHTGVMMAVGGAIDQIADPSLRSPRYIDSIGLGWLWRLIRQPWRWRRQLALLKFGWMVLAQAQQRS